MQSDLGHLLPLDAYLLKPVQRISKYQLLLKELLKYSTNAEEKIIIEKAMNIMLEVVNNLNDAMHASFIVGFSDLKSQGRLLKRDQLQMTRYKRSTRGSINVVSRLKLTEANKLVEVFLYEKALIICKRKTDESSFSNLSSIASVSSSSTSSTNSLSYLSAVNYQLFYQFKELIKVNYQKGEIEKIIFYFLKILDQ